MNNPSVSKNSTNGILIFMLILWMASLSCRTTSRTLASTTPTPIRLPQVQVSSKDGMEIILTPSGEFTMGSEDGEDNESPAHTVYLDDFWIDKTEVTNKMYYDCVRSGACESPLADGFIAPPDHYTNPVRENYPVVFVGYDNAKSYCQWVNRRLPTEAEWEKAAKGTDHRTYPWGIQFPSPELLNFNQFYGDLMPVGSFPLGASPYGVLDMAGNAWEWVADWYADDYYEYSPSINPIGPAVGEFRITRGGGYYQGNREVRVTTRSTVSPWYRQSADFGFRCAMNDILTTTSFILSENQ